MTKVNEHPVVTYLEKEKSNHVISTFFGLGVMTGFLWYFEFPFLQEYWGITSLATIITGLVYSLIHYLKFGYKKK